MVTGSGKYYTHDKEICSYGIQIQKRIERYNTISDIILSKFGSKNHGHLKLFLNIIILRILFVLAKDLIYNNCLLL